MQIVAFHPEVSRAEIQSRRNVGLAISQSLHRPYHKAII